jgi:integrase
VKPGTVNRELGYYTEHSNSDTTRTAAGCSRSALSEVERARTSKRILKPELYQKPLLNYPKVLRLLFVIACHVGLRKRALLRINGLRLILRPTHLDGRDKEQPQARTSCRSDYGDMAKFIEMQPRTSEYLFARGSKPIRDFREGWNLPCQRARVPDLLFHDLRRTAVRNLHRASVPETVIMKITGHRTRSVFEKYNITDETDTHKAGRKAEVFLAREHEKVAHITSQQPERIN